MSWKDYLANIYFCCPSPLPLKNIFPCSTDTGVDHVTCFGPKNLSGQEKRPYTYLLCLVGSCILLRIHYGKIVYPETTQEHKYMWGRNEKSSVQLSLQVEASLGQLNQGLLQTWKSGHKCSLLKGYVVLGKFIAMHLCSHRWLIQKCKERGYLETHNEI